MSADDPFDWDDNEEDQVRASCACGWAGEWHDWIKDVRAEERGHNCEQAAAWRAAR